MSDNLSLPEALLKSLEEVPGYDRSAFADAQRQPAPASIRRNPAKPISPEFTSGAERIPWSEEGWYLPFRPAYVFDPGWHGGAYYVQEAGSQFLHHLLLHTELPANSRVLDLCAAPGGKSTLLSAFFPEGLVVANEIIKARNAVLVENLTKWGGWQKVVTCNDPQHFQRMPDFFDLIVIDAPCSGSGLMRRDPEAITEWSPEAVTHCALRQRRILTDVLPALAPGGYLIYSTCSYSPEENEEICDFIMETGALEPVPIPLDWEWNISPTSSYVYQAPGYRFYPHRTRSEGFFCAVFRKKGPGIRFLPEGRLPAAALSRNEQDLINPWLIPQVKEEGFFWKTNEQNLLVPAAHVPALLQLQQHLYLRMAGVELGRAKQKGWVPAHALAVSGYLSKEVPRIQLTTPQAISYLQKQDDLNLESAERGWLLATWQDLPLGWMKHLGNRINNYYPAAWRILKRG